MQVAIPCLHISLGMFHKLFQMYKLQGCHHLDLLLAIEKAEQGPSYDGDSCGQFVASVRHSQQLVLKAICSQPHRRKASNATHSVWCLLLKGMLAAKIAGRGKGSGPTL